MRGLAANARIEQLLALRQAVAVALSEAEKREHADAHRARVEVANAATIACRDAMRSEYPVLAGRLAELLALERAAHVLRIALLRERVYGPSLPMVEIVAPGIAPSGVLAADGFGSAIPLLPGLEAGAPCYWPVPAATPPQPKPEPRPQPTAPTMHGYEVCSDVRVPGTPHRRMAAALHGVARQSSNAPNTLTGHFMATAGSNESLQC